MKVKEQIEIVGQNELIEDTRKVLEIFRNSRGNIRPHFIVTGSSGNGKTWTIQTLCENLGLPTIEINAAQITKEGLSGNSLSKVLAPVANYKGKPIVALVDEFDKLFISGNNGQLANEVTTGVQNEFLKVLESPTTQVFGDYGKYNTVDVSQVLFVFLGAFNNTEDMTIDKLREFGVKTEFLGRVGLLYNAKPLTIDDMKLILNKSHLLGQYLELFPDADKDEVIKVVGSKLESIHENNTLGARIINNLVHQYFIKGGVLEDKQVDKMTFSSKMTLGSSPSSPIGFKVQN